MAVQIQIRRGTAAQWTSANPTLASGELAHETDTGKIKVGDGSTAWSSLSYFTAGSGDMTGVDITAGDGLDITQSNTTSGDYTATISADLKANGGIVVESTELAVDLGASSITGTLAAADGGTGLTSISTLLNSNTTKGDVGLGNVENTALSTWAGSGNITQVGTISSGTWNGTAIAYSALSGTPTLGTSAALDVGISNNNVLQADANVADNDFLKVAGTQIEGRSASEVLSDIGAAASSHNHAAGDITSGTLAVARIPDITLAKVTDSGGAAALDVGTGAGTVCAGDDGRLSDARTPTSHNHAASEITSGTLAVARIPDLTLSKITDAGTAAAAATGDFEASGSIATHNAITTAHGISAFGATLVDDADAATARTTLGAAASNHTHTLANITDSGTAAALDVGITSNDVLQVATSGVTANEFLRLEALGTKVISRTAAEVLSDIGAQASLTFGISNTNAVKVDSASVADDEYARFTANGLESRSNAEVLSDIGAAAAAHTHTDSYTGQIVTAAVKTYYVDPFVSAAMTITGFYIKCLGGSGTASLKNGSNVVKTVNFTTSTGDQSSLSNTSVSAGAALTLDVTTNTSATDILFVVEFTS